MPEILHSSRCGRFVQDDNIFIALRSESYSVMIARFRKLSNPRKYALFAVALLVTIALVRIASTFAVFSATPDEAMHIGAGLELFEYRRYELQRANPPLPRVILAIAPWIGGMRVELGVSFDRTLHSVFHGRGEYTRNLILARLGNLLFIGLAAAALYVWSRREADEGAAVLAVLLFTTQPIVLGYAGIANHDIADTAGVAVALLVFSEWLRRPDAIRAAALGGAYGFGTLCKFSSIIFVPAVCAAIYAVRLIRDPMVRRQMPRAIATLLLVPIAAFFVIWAGYAFTVGQIGELMPWRDQLGPLLGSLDPSLPLPAPAFFAGILERLRIEQMGHPTYLFGQRSVSGWWWYFPVAVLLKTTIPSLLLLFGGALFTWRATALRWAYLESAFGAAAILAVTLGSKLTVGVRYLLALYVPASLAAAAAALVLLSSRSRLLRAAAVLLLVLHLGSSIAVHPDYFPYFNRLAGADPSRYLIDSNLDRGQDVLRLRDVVRKMRIERIGLSLMGPADYEDLGFPEHYLISPWQPVNGWIAVSDHSYRMAQAEGGWWWLQGRKYRRIGKSIRLSYIP